LTIKRLSLTVFFVVLTLSIGLVSVNLPLSSYGQNSALSQNGNGDDAGQGTGQVQTSHQDNQVVSGDATTLSGNNVQCQDQENSDIVSNSNEGCPANSTQPPSVDEKCYFCINALGSPTRQTLAIALGIGPSTNPGVICDAISQFRTPEDLAQTLNQGGVDRSLIAYVLSCLYGIQLPPS